MRTIEEICLDWKVTYGVLRSGSSGTYRSIPREGKRDMLNDLVQTMIDEGYTHEDIKSGHTIMMVVKYSCPPPEAKVAKLKIMQDITKSQWREAVAEVFKGKISKFVPKEPEKPASYSSPETKAKSNDDFDYSKAEIHPTNALVVDQTGYADTVYDEEFMKDLGINPAEWAK